MAARLARSKATVEVHGGPDVIEHSGVSVVVRNEKVTIRRGADVLIEREGVARVVPRARRSWTLMFHNPASEADVMVVTDERRACCGRR